jgi:hypothetical protein
VHTKVHKEIINDILTFWSAPGGEVLKYSTQKILVFWRFGGKKTKFSSKLQGLTEL